MPIRCRLVISPVSATLDACLSSVGQLRMWRSWQRVDRLEDLRSPFPPDAPQTQIVPELMATERETVFDKLTFSAFPVSIFSVHPASATAASAATGNASRILVMARGNVIRGAGRIV